MGKMIVAVLAFSLLFPVLVAAQLKTPAPSPTQSIKQDFGLGSIELSYSRPGVKKRTVFGDIVPYGKVWRTGANNATTISFSDEVMIGITKIPAGKYGLLSIPQKKSWIVILSKQTDVTNPANYKQDQDIVRIKVSVDKLLESTETLTMQFTDVKPESCALQIAWDKTSVSIPITADIDSRVMAQIAEAMKTDKPPYYQAAVYYMENDKDLTQALDWFNKAVEAEPNAYYIQYQWATCLAKLDKKSEAKAAATRSRELAAAAKNDDYVRLNDKLLAELAK